MLDTFVVGSKPNKSYKAACMLAEEQGSASEILYCLIRAQGVKAQLSGLKM